MFYGYKRHIGFLFSCITTFKRVNHISNNNDTVGPTIGTELTKYLSEFVDGV